MPAESRKVNPTRAAKSVSLTKFIEERNNKFPFWASEYYVNTIFALRQFQKVFYLNETSVKEIDRLLTEYGPIDEMKKDPNLRAGYVYQPEENVEENKEEERLDHDEGTSHETTPHDTGKVKTDSEADDDKDDRSSVAENGNEHPSSSAQPTVHSNDFPVELREMFLKLMIPCNRKVFLSRLRSIVAKTLPPGVTHPLGEDTNNIVATSLPPEARLFLLSSAVGYRVQQDSSQNVDNEHGASDLRPVQLGKDSLGNQYWFFHDKRIWVELKEPRRYPEPTANPLDTPWEWAYEMVTDSACWLCVADYDEDTNSWETLLEAVKGETKLCKSLRNLFMELKPHFEEEAEVREAERLKREKLEHQQEMKRIREMATKFAVDGFGVYGLRVSSRLQQRQHEMEAKKQQETEEDEKIDEMLGLRRPKAKKGRYEQDDDYILNERSESRERDRKPADPSHGLSREERLALRQSRLAEKRHYDGETMAHSASAASTRSNGESHEEYSEGREERNTSVDSASSASGSSQKRPVVGVGDQGEFVLSIAPTKPNNKLDDRNGDQFPKSDVLRENDSDEPSALKNGEA